MRKNRNKALYESIMSKVSRVVKQALNEGTPLDQRPYLGDNDPLNVPFKDRPKKSKEDIERFQANKRYKLIDAAYAEWIKKWGDIADKCLTLIDNLVDKDILEEYEIDSYYFTTEDIYYDDIAEGDLDNLDYFIDNPQRIFIDMKKPLQGVAKLLYQLNDMDANFEDFMFGETSIGVQLDEETYNVLKKIKI